MSPLASKYQRTTIIFPHFSQKIRVIWRKSNDPVFFYFNFYVKYQLLEVPL